MKKIIASILTALTVGASAQLTYVTTLDGSIFGAMNVEYYLNLIDNDKYAISLGPRYGESTLHEYYDILNPDFSLHKRITIDTAGWGALGINDFGIFFSDHLYNSDDKVEMIYYFCNRYWDNESSKEIKTNLKTLVIDEDGIVLQTIDNVAINENILQLNGKTYLQGKNGTEDEVAIYEIAGTLPCKTCSSSEATSNKKAPEKAYDINVFPNPTTNQITLAINTDKTGMKVHIYSTDGKLVKSASVVNGNNLIDTAELVSGTYIYNVQTDTEVIHASQFVKK
jgi:hypothetical protein